MPTLRPRPESLLRGLEIPTKGDGSLARLDQIQEVSFIRKGTMNVKPRSARVALAAVLVGATALMATTAGSASLLPGSSCNWPSQKQPFMPWLDAGSYFLAPGGSMEGSFSGWALAGGAAAVSGNEPWRVGASSDSRSLALPSGSFAQTPTICVTTLSPDLRFFAVNAGSASSTLRVDLLYVNTFGKSAVTTVARLSGGSQWAVSPIVLFLTNVAVRSALDGSTPVSFRFVPEGAGSGWRIDDLHVDPLKGH